jgi:YD repeat-containing protein
MVYDGLGRTIHQTDPSGATIDTTHDGLGHVSTVSNPHFTSSSPSDGTTTYAYDALGRTLLQTHPDGFAQHWSYNGNVTTFTDEASHSWSRTSDALGRLTNVVEPTGASTGYVYDALNNLRTVNQNGISISGETPRTRSFVYDALNRVTQKSSPGGSGVPGFTYSYGYDSITDGTVQNGIGRLLFTSTPNVAQIFASYDAMGRVTSQQTFLPSAPTTAATVSATYDLAGHINSLSYPDGRTIKQTWDGGGHLIQIADANGDQYLTQASYWPNGAVQSTFYGNTVQNGYDMNNRLEMDESGVVRPGLGQVKGISLSIKEYCYGPNTAELSSTIPGCTNSAGNPNGIPNTGNIWQIMDILNGAATQNFNYDNLNRLVFFQQAQQLASEAAEPQQNYSYDSFGNLNQLNGSLNSNATFGANNRVNNLPRASSLTPFDAAGKSTLRYRREWFGAAISVRRRR